MIVDGKWETEFGEFVCFFLFVAFRESTNFLQFFLLSSRLRFPTHHALSLVRLHLLDYLRCLGCRRWAARIPCAILSIPQFYPVLKLFPFTFFPMIFVCFFNNKNNNNDKTFDLQRIAIIVGFVFVFYLNLGQVKWFAVFFSIYLSK